MSKRQSNLSKWMPTGMLVAGIFLLAAVAQAETHGRICVVYRGSVCHAGRLWMQESSPLANQA